MKAVRTLAIACVCGALLACNGPSGSEASGRSGQGSSASDPYKVEPKAAEALSAEVRRVLEQASQVTLYSTEPWPSSTQAQLDKARRELEEAKRKSPDGFFGEPGGKVRPDDAEHIDSYTVLGKHVMSDAERREVVQAIYTSLSDGDGQQAKCFDPRHAIRATLGENTVTLLICFSCNNFICRVSGGARSESGFEYISKSAQPVLNRILDQHGIPRDGK